MKRFDFRAVVFIILPKLRTTALSRTLSTAEFNSYSFDADTRFVSYLPSCMIASADCEVEMLKLLSLRVSVSNRRSN